MTEVLFEELNCGSVVIVRKQFTVIVWCGCSEKQFHYGSVVIVRKQFTVIV